MPGNVFDQKPQGKGAAGPAKETLRPGVVVSTDPAAGTVRVQFGDQDGLVSNDLPVLVPRAHLDKAYVLPDVGDQVLCGFLPTGNESGFVLGAMYSKADVPPVASQDKWHVAFQDGTTVEYDRAASKLTINSVGDVSVTAAGRVDVTAPQIELTGAVTITGPLTVTGPTSLGASLGVAGSISAGGSIIDAGGNTNHHVHP
jgi:phage baseplate assembly protein V